jgi:hypothetical protein
MDRLAKSPLDEGPGESYHRVTNLTQSTAPAAKEPWVMASTRHTQSLSISQDFIDSNGFLGAKVFRFEWQNFKRVLQLNRQKPWRPVQLNDSRFFQKLYKLDANADDDEWLKVCVTPGPRVPPPPPDNNDRKLQHEYLKTVIKVDCYYSVPLINTAMDGAGGVEDVVEQNFFMVLEHTGGSAKPRVVPTLGDANDANHTAAAVIVQHLLVWRPHSDAHVTVCFEDEPVSINLLDLGPWPLLFGRLLEWTFSPSVEPHCFDLVSPTRAVPTMALTDASCPALQLIAELRRMLWKGQPKKATHVCTTLKIYDGRNAVRNKRYLQILIALSDYLSSNPSISSGQPGSYYELVLHRVLVAPGQNDAFYRQQLNALRDGTPMLALAPPAAPPALADANSDDDWGMIGDGAASPKRRRRLHESDVLASPSSSSANSHAESASQCKSDDGSDSSGFGIGGRSFISDWVQIVDGPRVKLDQYKARKKHLYMRWVGECVHHPGCSKKRSVNSTTHFGNVEPLAFLYAWNAMGEHLTAAEHCKRSLKVSAEFLAVVVKKLDGKCDPILELLTK